jgi:hypothetical protein
MPRGRHRADMLSISAAIDVLHRARHVMHGRHGQRGRTYPAAPNNRLRAIRSLDSAYSVTISVALFFSTR